MSENSNKYCQPAETAFQIHGLQKQLMGQPSLDSWVTVNSDLIQLPMSMVNLTKSDDKIRGCFWDSVATHLGQQLLTLVLRITAIDPFEIDKQTEQERDEVKDPEATITNQHFCICQRLQKPVILGSTRLHVGNIWLMSCSELDYKSHYYGWWGKRDTLDIMHVVDDISHNYFLAKKYTHLPLEWIDEWIQTKMLQKLDWIDQ
jgi:hypothetical protein